MKRLIATALIGVSLLLPVNVKAEELQEVQITAYCISGKTASGEQTHEGGCAFRKDLIGRRVNVYSQDMVLLGTFTVNDTGGKRIREGRTIDIWQPERKVCYQWTQPGYVEILPEEGGTENNVDATGAEVISGDPGNGGNGQVNPGGDVSSVD